MTFASKITLTRMALIPVFVGLALAYGKTVHHHPNETLRMAALVVYILAATSDALDGWIARRFNQRSDFGAFIDPIADKGLLLSGVLTLSITDWGSDGWRLPVYKGTATVF
jgi:phosphatidylglycerophosphate synthase